MPRKSTLLNEIEAASRVSGNRPKMDLILGDLDPADRDDLLAALNDRRYSCAQISRVLCARGLTIKGEAIRRWREDNVVGS